MKVIATLAALCIGIALGASPTKAPAATEGDFNTARAAFQNAGAGDSGAANDAAKQFAELLVRDPANPVLLAYHGAAVAMRARYAWFPWRKMSLSEDGLAEIDRALVSIKPQHETAPPGGVPPAVQTKFIAANTFLAMPSMMNRHAQGEKILNEVLTTPAFSTSPAGFRKAVHASALRYLAASNPQKVPLWQSDVADSGPNGQTSAH